LAAVTIRYNLQQVLRPPLHCAKPTTLL